MSRKKRELLMEDSMFDEQFVTTAEEIKEAREALIELGKDIARRGNEIELWQAQIAYSENNGAGLMPLQ